MAEEIELKFLDVDHDALREQARKLGGTCTFEGAMRSASFVGPGLSPVDSSLGYLRVRQLGDRVLLTFKGALLDGGFREETEVEVSSFDTMVKVLEHLGFSVDTISHKHRESWAIGDVELVLDITEGLPPYCEVEAPDEDSLVRSCKALGLDPSRGTRLMITECYPEFFGLR